tara:strand:- start:358 stop:1035 length:678 start_codon:yes stop_codon:yes gene_type:complete
MKAMILAAGRGERMGELTNTIPKPLTRISNSTLIEQNIRRIRKSGIKDIIINVSWLGNKIIDHLGDGSKYDVKISFSDEGNNMLGTGGGILNALNLLDENPFWLVNADLYSDYSIDTNMHLANDDLAHLVLVDNPKHHPDGDYFLKKGRISVSNTVMPLTFSGISMISPKIFKNIKEKVFPLEPILNRYASKNKISGEHFKGTWIDVGTQKRLKDVIMNYQNSCN